MRKITATEYRWSQIVQPGMVVRDLTGRGFPVEQVTELYNTVEYTSNGHKLTVPYGERVEIMGYFNL